MQWTCMYMYPLYKLVNLLNVWNGNCGTKVAIIVYMQAVLDL